MIKNIFSHSIALLIELWPSDGAKHFLFSVGMSTSHRIKHLMESGVLISAVDFLFKVRNSISQWIKLQMDFWPLDRALGFLFSTGKEQQPSDIVLDEFGLSDRAKNLSPIVDYVVHRILFWWTTPLNLWTEQSIHHASKVIFNIFFRIFCIDFCSNFYLKNKKIYILNYSIIFHHFDT